MSWVELWSFVVIYSGSCSKDSQQKSPHRFETLFHEELQQKWQHNNCLWKKFTRSKSSNTFSPPTVHHAYCHTLKPRCSLNQWTQQRIRAVPMPGKQDIVVKHLDTVHSFFVLFLVGGGFPSVQTMKKFLVWQYEIYQQVWASNNDVNWSITTAVTDVSWTRRDGIYLHVFLKIKHESPKQKPDIYTTNEYLITCWMTSWQWYLIE